MCLRLQTNTGIKSLTTDILSAWCFVPQNYNTCRLLRDVKTKCMFAEYVIDNGQDVTMQRSKSEIWINVNFHQRRTLLYLEFMVYTFLVKTIKQTSRSLAQNLQFVCNEPRRINVKSVAPLNVPYTQFPYVLSERANPLE